MANLQNLKNMNNNMSYKMNENNSLNNLIRSNNNNIPSDRSKEMENNNFRYDTEEHLFNDQSVVMTQSNEMCNISPKKAIDRENRLEQSRPFSSILNSSEAYKGKNTKNPLNKEIRENLQLVQNREHPPTTKNAISSINADSLIKENYNTKNNEVTKSNIQFIYNSVFIIKLNL